MEIQPPDREPRGTLFESKNKTNEAFNQEFSCK